MKRVTLARSVACALAVLVGEAAAAEMDFTPRPLERLPAGDFSPQALPNGYSHVVMIAWPRIAPASLENTPSMAAKFAQMFGSVILADVRRPPGAGGEFKLSRLAIGHTMRVGKQVKVVRPDSDELTFVASQVLASGEKELDKIRQIARYNTALLFETPAIMLRNGQHQEMALRQFIWTSAKQGGLGSALWLIDNSQPESPRVADNYFVQLPAGYQDDRLLSVDAEQFNLLGMPGRTAFALVALPKGTRAPFTPELARLAATPRYTPETLPRLAQQLAIAIASNKAPTVSQR